MKCASLSLAVTAFYVLMIVYAADTARLLGPVYGVCILFLWWYGHHSIRHHRDD